MTHLERIDQLGTFTKDWNSYGADPPSETAQTLAREYLKRCEDNGVKVDRIVASAEGGIALCFLANDWQADIEVFNDGEVLGGVYLKTEKTVIMDFAEQSLETFLERITSLRTAPPMTTPPHPDPWRERGRG